MLSRIATIHGRTRASPALYRELDHTPELTPVERRQRLSLEGSFRPLTCVRKELATILQPKNTISRVNEWARWVQSGACFLVRAPA